MSSDHFLPEFIYLLLSDCNFFSFSPFLRLQKMGWKEDKGEIEQSFTLVLQSDYK
jgi:hypothetical protein